ncbi:MAG: ATP-binding protein, partial [Actinomycetota bacterium]
KSRLMAESRRRALSGRHGSPVAWLEGRCLSYAESVPYSLFRDLLSGWLGIAPNDTEGHVPPTLRGHAALPVWSDTTDTPYLELLLTGEPTANAGAGQDAESLRERVFAAAEATFLRLAASCPLVLSLEDLHWADPTSLALTERLLTAVANGPLLVLATLRPVPEHPSADMIEAVAGRLGPNARRIRLGSLTDREDRELFDSLPGTEAVPNPIRLRILGTTEGNPFFLEEQVRSLAETGQLALGPDGRWRFQGGAEHEIPRTVERVLLARIDRLGPDEKDVLTAAAVLGREFQPDLLARLVEDDRDVGAVLDALDRIDLVRAERHGSDIRFRFRHALIQEAAYRSLLKRKRKELHSRAAAAIESLHAERTDTVAGALGHHLQEAGESERAVPYLMAAGDRAREAFANEEALSWYEQALEALLGVARKPAGRDRWAIREADLHSRRGRVLGLRGRYEEAREAYRRSIALLPPDDPVRSATARTEAAWIETSDHRYAEALAELDRAEDALGDLGDATSDVASDPERLSAWLEIQDARMSVYYWLEDLGAFADLIKRVRPIVERGSPEQRAGFYGALLTYCLRRDRYVVSDEALGYARANLAAAEQVGERSRAWALFHLGFTLLWAGRFDEVAEPLRTSLREAERMGDITLRSRARTYLMVLDRRRGDPQAVERAIEPVIEAARDASLPEYEAMALANRSWVHLQADDVAEAEADARAALDLWRALPVRYPFEWMALWPLIGIELGRGGVAEAVAWARDLFGQQQQPIATDLRSQLERAFHAWDAGNPGLAERELRGASHLARRLAHL